MDHMKFETPDIVGGNIEKIGALFPSAVTEMRDEHGKVKKGINFEVLKQLLSRDAVDGDECYEFTWVGKKAAIAEAARPTTNTLRPVKEDSKDWDTTENLYIEGDNLEVLKILQESYLGKVKMIYIDPPYNTGHDFIYPDSFVMDDEEYSSGSGYFDEEGNVNYARENSASVGKYHSDWCSMMYSRLTLARNLLTDDGVIFISIDDNEQMNMNELAREVFGTENFVSQLIWEKKFAPQNDDKYITALHDYILVFAKNKANWRPRLQERSAEALDKFKNPDNDVRGVWTSGDLTSKTKAQGHSYAIVSPAGKEFYPPAGRQWAPSYDTYLSLKNDNRLWFGVNGDNVPRQKQFLNEIQSGVVPTSLLFHKDCGHNQEAKKEILSILPKVGSTFETPKPVRLIEKLLKYTRLEEGDIILDFFSGSGTTAHAVMKMNAEDGGHRKFIMVQLPEPCDEKSEADKAGYTNICEIGKERIRRAGDKIKEENPLGTKDLDTGFRVFRVDSSNMKDVYYHPEELDQMSLSDMISNIKDDRTDMDLLYACLLDWGVEINLPHTSTEIDGCTVHNVDNGALIACFDADIPASVIRYMAQQQPLRAVFHDSGFSADDAKINVTETFKNFSPDTSVRVI